MGSKEIPDDIRRHDSSIRIEVRIVWNLARNVHRDAVPFVVSAEQAVELHFGVRLAARGILSTTAVMFPSVSHRAVVVSRLEQLFADDPAQ